MAKFKSSPVTTVLGIAVALVLIVAGASNLLASRAGKVGGPDTAINDRVPAPESFQPAAGEGQGRMGDAAEKCNGAVSASPTAAGGGCKPCKGAPFCGCTLNGAPRVSCDPCCYYSFSTGYFCIS